ncbi:unnamed protein product [Camellia sinensis]
MENTKQVSGGGSYSSSSSFTLDLFGPKDPSSSSSSSTDIFGSVFGPPSTGLGKDSSHTGFMGSMKMQDFASQYGIAKHGTPDNMSQRGKGEASVEPCYFSSSIYYGGQEVYPPTTHTTVSQHIFKKDGRDDDPNGSNLNGASRGNWWVTLLLSFAFVSCQVPIHRES